MTAELLANYQAATVAAATTVAKGDALANYIGGVFEQLDGVSCAEKKVVSDDQSQELDVILWNERNPGPLGLDFLPSIVPVEAKNWSRPVGAAEIAWFKDKVVQGGVFQGGWAAGLLVAPEGITGSHDDARFAAAVILRARQEKVAMIVATPDELAHDAAELREYLKARLIGLVAGRAGLPS